MGGRQNIGVAKFDISTGMLIDSFNSPFFLNDYESTQIFSLASDGNRLFAGGAGFVYQLDALSGQAIYVTDTTSLGQTRHYLWRIGVVGFVHALAVQNQTLYLGGGFLSVTTSKYPENTLFSRRSAAAIYINNLVVKAWDPGLIAYGGGFDEYRTFYSAYIGKITIRNNLAYIAGSFGIISSRGNKGLAAIDISTANASSWSPIDSVQTAINKSRGFTDSVFAGGSSLFLDNELIYSGTYQLSAFDTAVGSRKVWSADTTQYISQINTILVHNNVVYAGGSGLAAFKAYTRPLTTSVARTQESLSNAPLLSVHPNPTDGGVAIASYLLPAPCRVRLELFDILGRSVRVCVQEAQTAGEHTALIQTTDLPAGVYFLVLESASGKSMQRLVVGR
jgi:hypothetical protein